VFVADIETQTVKMVNFLNKQDLSQGYYSLLRTFKNKLIVEYSSVNQPPEVYVVTFNSTQFDGGLDALLAKDNLHVQLLERVDLDRRDDISKDVIDTVKDI